MLTKEQRAENIEHRFISQKRIFYILFSIFYSLNSIAQCAMCRASLESEGNKAKVEAVNDGIVLLMAVPYIIVGVIGFAIYRMYFKKKSA
ncbi:MAG TPA: hypothetical protein PKN96_07085 [Flavobacterium sp.]|uniref:hypothetical protein n=1 Tax=Flavobacterium sp. TaxID=239 RepID=UPI002CB312BF|nr:hypothetical protein [Flavobacterium sp.]HNP33041.1 hypothetical protein [Flavobacterium sp.]